MFRGVYTTSTMSTSSGDHNSVVVGIPPTLKPIRTTRPAPLPGAPRDTGLAPAVFSPYVECWTNLDIRQFPGRSVTIAFLLNNKGRLAWDGTMTLNHWLLRAKNSGKQIVLSFGGAAGTELATAVTDPKAVADQYIAAATMYGATRLDFDIEGAAALSDAKTNQRRNQALKLVQQVLPGVALQYTFPVMPFGLDENCLAVLRDAKDRGIKLHAVNIMAMNYGDEYRGDMGDYAIQAARATRGQLRDLGLVDVGVGITPMVLENDVKTNVFDLKNADKVADFAAAKPWVKFVGYWAAGRDPDQKFARLFASKLQ